MNTKLVKVEKECPDLQIMKEAGEILKNGGLVAFPTETVYGPVSYTHLEHLQLPEYFLILQEKF